MDDDTQRPKLKRPWNPMPDDVRESLSERGLTASYDERPPYQRNDYIGWISRAKREETRLKRIEQMLEELEKGGVYMKMSWNPRKR